MNNRNLAGILFEDMDIERRGILNLENMRKLYESIASEYKDVVREKLRKFIIDHQRFTITKEEFLQLFPKNPTPCIHITLTHIKDTPRIRELSPTELRGVICKRIESKAVSNYKPKFIKKVRSSSRPIIKIEAEDKIIRNKDLFFVRKAYFSSLS